MTTPTARRVLAALSTMLALAAGAALWHHLPESTGIFAPFDVQAGVGERAQGRGLSATVESVTVTPTLVTASKTLPAVGVWVVVELAAEAGPEYALAHADLMVGDSRYVPTDRIISGPPTLAPRIIDHREWAFDVSPDRLAAVDEIRFRIWVGDERLDSRLVFTIPMDGTDVRQSATLELASPSQEAA